MKKTIIIALSFLFFLAGSVDAQIIHTFAGKGAVGFNGDFDFAANTELWNPIGVAVDDTGNVYITESGAGYSADVTDKVHPDVGVQRVRKVFPSGVIKTITRNFRDNSKQYYLQNPHGIAVDYAGNIYVAEYEYSVVYKITSTGRLRIFAGIPNRPGYSGDGGQATAAQLCFVNSIAVDAIGNVYIADEHNNVIRKVALNGVITTVAGNGTKGYSGDGELATEAALNRPWGLALDSTGNMYIADSHNQVIRKVTPTGTIRTIAGNGTKGYDGDGGQALQAQLNYPNGIAIDNTGNLYIAEAENHVIRRVAPDGIITTVAGNGKKGSKGDGKSAIEAELFLPYGVAVDKHGNLYISDIGNDVVRKVTFPTPGDEANKKTFNISADADKGELTINTDAGVYTSFTITDFNGKEVAQNSIRGTTTVVNVSALPPGSYYVNLKKGDSVKTTMFVKEGEGK